MPNRSVRLSTGLNRYGGLGEYDMVFTTNGPAVKPYLIVAHGRGSTAYATAGDASLMPLWYELAEYYTVCVSDLGGATAWGSSDTQNAISTIITMLQSAYPSSFTKVALVGVSMGGLAVLNWAKANPSSTAWVGCIAPALNIDDLRYYNATTDSNNGVDLGTYAAEIDAAYGGKYVNSTYGATYSPWYYGSAYPASTVPTAIWTSPADTVVRNQWADAFVVARPEIQRFLIRSSSGTSYPHTSLLAPAVAGLPNTAYAFPRFADWCIARRWTSSF